MTATLLTVGDELLIGQIVNGNAAWLGERLGQAGVRVVESRVVGDDVETIAKALRDLASTSDVLVVTGGLGPTHDDLTRDALALVYDAPLAFDPHSMARIEARFASRGRPMPARNRVQAMIPSGFDALDNDHGSAPGLSLARGGRLVVALPGVPNEMRSLVDEYVVPRIEAMKTEVGESGYVVRHRTLMTAGIGESALADRIGDLAAWLDARTHLAFLPSFGTVRLRVSAEGDDAAEVDARVERFLAHLRTCAGRHVAGEVPSGMVETSTTLDALVVARLRQLDATLAVAESCTGGLVLDRLTDVPGASAVLHGGVVAYDNEVKMAALGVPEAILAEHGAVSEPVARAMAEGVRTRLGATFGLSTTGIAGPTGGTDEKPVGTVWIAVATPEATTAGRFLFGTERRVNKQLFATTALDRLRVAMDVEE